MKKILSIAFFILFILLFSSGCTKKPRVDISKIPNSYYENIESISYKSISYMGDGGTKTKTIDFNENKVIIVQEYIGYYDEESTTSYEYQIDSNKTLEFLKKFKETGILDLKRQYITNERILDGGGWNFVVKFRDGSEQKSTGSNAKPREIFQDADKVFYSFFKGSFLGALDSEYYNIPYMTCYLNNGNTMRQTYSPYCVHDWLREEKPETLSVDNLKNTQNTIFDENTSYQFIFNKDKMKSYTYYIFDENLETQLYSSQKHIFSSYENKATIDLELNKIYKIVCDYNNGSIIHYYSTLIIDDSVLPDNFYISFYWSNGDNELSLNISNKRSSYLINLDIDHKSYPYSVKEKDLYQIFKEIFALKLELPQTITYNKVYGDNQPLFKLYFRYYGITHTIEFFDLVYLAKYDDDSLNEANQLLDQIYSIYCNYLQYSFEKECKYKIDLNSI